jgi:hypothetical protein
MACDAVTDFLHRETGRFVTPIMERRVFPRSIWMNIVRRGEWLPGMGTTIKTLVYERSAPTDAQPTWNAIEVADGQEGGSCLPASTRISVASTTREFSLARRVLEGPDICNIDSMPSFALQQQLESTLGILADYARIEWEIRYRHEYFRLCQTKVVLDSATTPTTTTTMATTYPAVAPSLPLHIKILRSLSIDLMRDGAGADALLRRNGAPLLNVIASNESIGNIIQQNAEIREDIRHSNQANILINGFGISHSYGEFVFLADPFPRRFEEAGGVFTEVAAFSLTSATKGQKAIVNSSWKTATVEETFIFDPNVVKFLIPRPPTAPAANVQFDPVRFTGEVKLMNILDRTCNPDGNIVYHRMNMAAASMPGEPERGVAIAHLRCSPMGATTACAT